MYSVDNQVITRVSGCVIARAFLLTCKLYFFLHVRESESRGTITLPACVMHLCLACLLFMHLFLSCLLFMHFCLSCLLFMHLCLSCLLFTCHFALSYEYIEIYFQSRILAWSRVLRHEEFCTQTAAADLCCPTVCLPHGNRRTDRSADGGDGETMSWSRDQFLKCSFLW